MIRRVAITNCIFEVCKNKRDIINDGKMSFDKYSSQKITDIYLNLRLTVIVLFY